MAKEDEAGGEGSERRKNEIPRKKLKTGGKTKKESHHLEKRSKGGKLTRKEKRRPARLGHLTFCPATSSSLIMPGPWVSFILHLPESVCLCFPSRLSRADRAGI